MEIQRGNNEERIAGHSAKCVQSRTTGSRRVVPHAKGEGQINKIVMQMTPGPLKSVRRCEEMRGTGPTESPVHPTLTRRMRGRMHNENSHEISASVAEVRKSPYSVGCDRVALRWPSICENDNVMTRTCRGSSRPNRLLSRAVLALPRSRLVRRTRPESDTRSRTFLPVAARDPDGHVSHVRPKWSALLA